MTPGSGNHPRRRHGNNKAPSLLDVLAVPQEKIQIIPTQQEGVVRHSLERPLHRGHAGLKVPFRILLGEIPDGIAVAVDENVDLGSNPVRIVLRSDRDDRGSECFKVLPDGRSDKSCRA